MKNYWLYSCFIGLLVLLGLSYVFQWTALFRALPWFFILLCPLMMLGMHGGHGDHSRSKDTSPEEDEPSHKH